MLPHLLCLIPLSLLVPKSESVFQDEPKSNLSLVGTIEAEESGPWGSLLEEWAIGHKDSRQARIMKLPSTQGYYITNRNDPPGFDEWPAKTPPPPGKIVNRPPNPYLNKEKQKPAQQREPPPAPHRKEVTETDLYLLGAIEKLVYRVDFMEKRLRKMEEMMVYWSGNQVEPEVEPCDHNYTRVAAGCYHFGQGDMYDWKTANLVCRKLKGHLLELETEEENRNLVAFIHAHTMLRGKDYWTGGLNPGLLWIWSNSARPVPDGNKNDTQTINEAQANTTASHIHGNGRCLKLSYNPALNSYPYFGFDCAIRQNYICELPDTKLSNKVDKIARSLKLAD